MPRSTSRNQDDLVQLAETTSASNVRFDATTIETLVRDMTPLLAPLIKQVVNDVFDEKLAAIATSVEKLKSDCTVISGRVSTMERSVDSLTDRATVMDKRLNDLEQYSRRDNLVIFGLTVSSYAEAANTGHADAANISTPRYDNNVINSVLTLFNDVLNMNVRREDISAAHRLTSRRPDDRMQQSVVIVKFNSSHTRDRIYASRVQLKNYTTVDNRKIYINEHLTEFNQQLFKKTRQLLRSKKINGTWTHLGSVYIKTGIDRAAVTKRIICQDELSGLA
jgi:hypothetical protein